MGLPRPASYKPPEPPKMQAPSNDLPASFARDGFGYATQVRQTRRLMIGTDGEDNTGKTEFILSCPDPGIMVCLDRGYDAALDNATPPPTRRKRFAVKPINVPLVFGGSGADYDEYWKKFKSTWYTALANPDAVTVALDGDSDSWELQLLVEFGRLKQIHPLQYTDPNAIKRAMIARAHDTGKIIVCTHKVKPEYEDAFDAQGNPIIDDKGKNVQKRTGGFKRQGFKDMNYLFNIQLRHLYKPPTYSKVLKRDIPGQFGIRLLRCKVNRSLEGHELWGSECCFAGLVQYVYPQVAPEEWGL